ncbi:MAG: UxaA family hydrolase, partial [Desulfobacterales bacterium]|nr:UxaA family hydrolase [Desulfobacterales bacterium]
MSSKGSVIKIHHKDNVAVVVNAGGLSAGFKLDDGLELLDDVPQGHKVALSDIGEGDPILRYGETIGHAGSAIARGSWVREELVEMPQAPPLEKIPLTVVKAPALEPLDGYTFEGYRNADGTVGTKNILGITTSVQCVAPVAAQVAQRIRQELLPRFPNVDDVVALNHSYGCGVAIDSPAAVVPIRTLQNLILNPNLGGEVLLLGLGCEKLDPERLLPAGIDKDCVPVVKMQDESFTGYRAMVDAILAMAEVKLARLNSRHRETCPASDLVVGLQCGGSDAFSGVTANPAVGFAADLIKTIRAKDLDDYCPGVVITSSDDDEYSYESPSLQNSIFTYCLV